MRQALVLLPLAALGCASWRAPRAPAAVALRLVPPAQKIGTGEMYMDCAFDAAPRSCRLDTGAGDKILVHDDATFAPYPAAGSGSNANGIGARSDVDLIRIGRLRLGASDFGPVSAKRAKDPARAPFSPMIGPQAVTRRAFALRFSSPPQLVFDAPPPPGPFFPLGPFDRDRHLFITVDAGAEPFTALFDTGAGITEIDRDYVAAHPKDFTFVGVMQFPGRPDASIYELRALNIGGRRFDAVDVVAEDFAFMQKKTRDPSLRLLLGYDVITRADWSFDLARRRWSVSAP
jgi:hypothetical protein